MRYSVAAAALVAGVSASYGSASNATVYVTEVVSTYTTFCPSATEITHGTNTYTVTEATTLTITDCPCTVTKPVVSYTSAAPVPSTTAVYTTATPSTAAPVAPYPSSNATTATTAPVGTGSATTSAPVATFTGAASKVGAGMLAIFGLAALAL